MLYEYISSLILEKKLCLVRDFNQFYDEGYVKFLVSENRSIFFLFVFFFLKNWKFCLTNIFELM